MIRRLGQLRAQIGAAPTGTGPEVSRTDDLSP
eukprot:COSAG03_NODE_1119_length_4780_cov_155.441359_1_plen_31_part_10